MVRFLVLLILASCGLSSLNCFEEVAGSDFTSDKFVFNAHPWPVAEVALSCSIKLQVCSWCHAVVRVAIQQFAMLLHKCFESLIAHDFVYLINYKLGLLQAIHFYNNMK